ncbi:uncharacterized protein LOC123309881 [Coccinella septempunctata]|uniref:uncharacterized protein LOC123309881 n=1 Tax=Coccinella septempunctata TaxID=41139 RepID=UPI001D07A55E|nr:uncharacterized protein LOC123309881 [Coccinella septempunctata]
MSATKRIRGCNYTAEETNKLLDLVLQYHSAIEEKRTGAVFLARKKEAWEKICSAYNAVATSGIRSVESLKTFYDNRKQRARKSLAEHNKKEHRALQNITEGDLKTSLAYPTIPDPNQKVLAIIKKEVIPLPNGSDSAAFNFKDHSEDILIQPDVPHHILEPGYENHVTDYMETARHDDVNSPTNTENCEENDSSPKKKKIKKNLMYYKQLYFKLKCQNEYLQKRKTLQDIRLRQREHSMFMKEHNLKLEIMQKEFNEKFK